MTLFMYMYIWIIFTIFLSFFYLLFYFSNLPWFYIPLFPSSSFRVLLLMQVGFSLFWSYFPRFLPISARCYCICALSALVAWVTIGIRIQFCKLFGIPHYWLFVGKTIIHRWIRLTKGLLCLDFMFLCWCLNKAALWSISLRIIPFQFEFEGNLMLVWSTIWWICRYNICE